VTSLLTLPETSSARTPTQTDNFNRRWLILFVLGVAQLMVILDSTIVNIALPTAQHDLHFSNADRQWIVTAYSLAFGSLLLLGGRIGDTVGRKRALIVGLVGFAGASALGGAAINFVMLVVARSIQGAFAALLAPSVLALLTTTFSDPSERGQAFGVYGAIAGAGGALGLLLGGILTSYASWRWTLFVNLVFALVAVTGATLWLKADNEVSRSRFDLPGLILAGGGLFCVVFGFSHAETTTWSDPYTIGFLVVGFAMISAFFFVERAASHPLLPPEVVLDRTRGGSLLAMLFASIGIFGVFLFLTYYLQGTLGFSPIKTGVAFLPLVAALASTAQLSNRLLLPRTGPRPIIPFGLLLSAGALFGLHFIGLSSSYWSHVLPYLSLLGLGLGFSVAPAFSTGTLGLQPSDAGVGSAALNTAQQVGGSIGTSLLNTLAASAAATYLSSRQPSPTTVDQALVHSYSVAFLWSAVVFILGAVVTTVVLKSGTLATLASSKPLAESEPVLSGFRNTWRVRVACR